MPDCKQRQTSHTPLCVEESLKLRGDILFPPASNAINPFKGNFSCVIRALNGESSWHTVYPVGVCHYSVGIIPATAIENET